MASDCLLCGEEIKRNTNKVKCLMCDSVFHAACMKIKDELVKSIATNSNIKFVCNYCNNKSVFNELKEIRNTLNNCMEIIENQKTLIEGHSKLLKDSIKLYKTKKLT